MITWMQKNKKWLVITIWISTIAFVGAGFVGWGAYDFNMNRSNSVAKVGHRKISVLDFQKKYSMYYSYYNNMLEGKFTQEQADQMGLKDIVLQNLVQENLLLNYADDLGFMVSDSEISAYILNDPNFQKDGVFDRKIYENILTQNGIKMSQFEDSLKNIILLEKLLSSINVTSQPNDALLLASAYFMQDKVSLKVINADENIKISQDELKKFHAEHKDQFLTEKTYNIEGFYVKNTSADTNESELMKFYQENRGNYRSDDDKIKEFEEVKDELKHDFNMQKTKKIALEEYVKFKRNEKNSELNLSLTDSNATFPLTQISAAKVGEYIKPFEYNDGYFVAKLTSIKMPQTKTYEQAKNEVENIYLQQKKKENLNQKAKNALENFKSNKTISVMRDMDANISGLSKKEAEFFVAKLFEKTNKKGYIILDEKAVLYEIMEQNLANNEKLEKYKDMLVQSANNLINTELHSDLIAYLSKRYKVEYYYKR